MNECLAHRGPDDEGVSELRDAGGALCGAIGQRRLAIIDLSAGGHQPMFAAQGRYAIVFNGEIYNYRELRVELEANGAQFHSASDTEVILHGLARHGHGFVARLRGMFAFVHWDRDTRTATIARDRFGIKPLLWARNGGAIAFASELRALRTGGVVSDTIAPSAMDSYLTWGAVSEPETMLSGATALPAGAVATVEVRNGRASDPVIVARHLPLVPHEGPLERDPARAASLVRDALRQSVAKHLIADVPVAAFLSGGIDSSLVCAFAAEVSERPLDTFTVVFNEREFDEARHARAAARAIGATHHEIPLSAEEFLSSLDDAFAAMDQPSLDGLNTYVVSRAVRRAGMKVVLSGLGGDEMFAGYPSFSRARALSRGWAALRTLRPLGRLLRDRGVRGAKMAALLGARTPAVAAYTASRLLFPA
ncbi:MAG: asparagine synthase (glutamine-hydrolyzing), partial [Gemmatimonadaceae bacterium]